MRPVEIARSADSGAMTDGNQSRRGGDAVGLGLVVEAVEDGNRHGVISWDYFACSFFKSRLRTAPMFVRGPALLRVALQAA